MTEPRLATLKRLFAKSHNCCAFPKCQIPIVESSGTVTGIICHIKARSRGGPRFDSKLSDEQRHAFENLVLLCSRHSKVIDSEPKQYTVGHLYEMKEIHEREGWLELNSTQSAIPERLLADYRVIYINTTKEVTIDRPEKVVLPKARRVKIIPGNVLAGDADKRGYIMYLIARYHEFAKHDRADYNYMVIHGYIFRDFGKKIDHIAISLFERLAEYIKNFIDSETSVGKRNRREKFRSYRTYEEWLQNCQNAPRPKKRRRKKS